MFQALKNLGALFVALCRSEYGAFTLTNKAFQPPEASYMPAFHQELADVTLVGSTVTSATINTGVVGLKWMRVRAILKTLGGQAAGESVTISVQAGTGAAITGPTKIGQQTITMKTGDTAILFEFACWSNAGFQSYAITVDSSGAARVPVLDIMVDAA